MRFVRPEHYIEMVNHLPATTFRYKMSGLLQAGELLLNHGIPPADLLRQLELPPALLLDPTAWIDRKLCFRLTNEISSMLGDRFTGLHIAELTGLECLDELGNGMLCAHTLQDSIRHAQRDVPCMIPGTELHLDVIGKKAYLSFNYIGRLGEDPMQYIEGNLLSLRKMLNLADGEVPAEARLPHSTPRHSAELERLFGPRLRFNSDRAALVFDRDALCLPLQERPTVPATRTRAPTPVGPRKTAGAVMRVVRELIHYERPTAAAIAAELNMNLRTMQRHLALWGLTFEDLLDGYRRHRAIEYLHERELTITAIAFNLGYSDSAHFTRAFRRWTGHAPREIAAGASAH